MMVYEALICIILAGGLIFIIVYFGCKQGAQIRQETTMDRIESNEKTVKKLESLPPEATEQMGIYFEMWKRKEQPARDEKKKHFAEIRNDMREKRKNVEKRLDDEFRAKGISKLSDDELINYSRLIQLSTELKCAEKDAETNWGLVEPCCMQEFIKGVNLNIIPSLPAMISNNKIKENQTTQKIIKEKTTEEHEKDGKKHKVTREKETTIEGDGRAWN